MAFILQFFEGRKNAIEAWKLDGYMPMDDIEREYGLTVDDLFHAGLMVEKNFWTDLPSYPYTLSKPGRLLLSEDKEYSIILIKRGCLEKVFLALKKQGIEKLTDVIRSRHANGGERK